MQAFANDVIRDKKTLNNLGKRDLQAAKAYLYLDGSFDNLNPETKKVIERFLGYRKLISTAGASTKRIIAGLIGEEGKLK